MWIYGKAVSLMRPGTFLFSAVLVVCAASLCLNIRLAERISVGRARLLNEQAEQLRKEADRLVKP